MNQQEFILITPPFNQIEQLPSLNPFHHDLLTQKLNQLKNLDFFLDEQNQSDYYHQETDDVYFNLAKQIFTEQSNNSEKNKSQPNLIFSWDSFDRPIHSLSSLIYQTPYPTEESLEVWEAILSKNQSTLSSPISRRQFITDFFRRAIGLNTDTVFISNNKRVSLQNSYPRVLGQTDHSTRSIRNICDTAYQNLRTIESFINLRNHPYDPFQCLSSSLNTLIDWIRTEIMDCFETESVLDSGLLSTSLILDPVLQLLVALADLVETCEQDKNLMQEDAVYQNLNHHIESCSSSLIQVVFSWLLDRVCAALLFSWQTWLGIDFGIQQTIWGDEKDRLNQSLWNQYGIQSDHTSHDLVLDQLDQLGSITSSYSFKPNRVPRFFPINLAETVFKAGLSLRILRRSNPFHPICLTFPVQEDGKSRWIWTPHELEKVQKSFRKQRQDMEIQVSAWRHNLKLTTGPSVPPQTSFSKPKTSAIEQPLDINGFLDHIATGLNPHDKQVTELRYHHQCHEGLLETLEERLEHCTTTRSGLLHSMHLPSLDILTDLTVLESLRSRSQEIDRCLLSFFFIDLDLVNHLNILYRFMFCQDVMFNQRVSNALFSSNDGRRPVGVSARLLRRGTWPPGGFDLSFALRTVILDSVAFDQRPVSYCNSKAWDELEDRLSFAIRPGIEIDAMQTAFKAESISGFDFLMVDFKPPKALESLLGSDILEQYKKVNNYLMKLLRLQSMMRANWSLIRPRRQFAKHEISPDNSGRQQRYFHAVDILATKSQRLLDGLISYVWDIAIGRNWRSFITKIEKSQQAIQTRETCMMKTKEFVNRKEESSVELSTIGIHQTDFDKPSHGQHHIESIEELIKLHRLTLKEIMNCLFLRPKQQMYSNLLSRSIFETIIELSIHLEGNYNLVTKEASNFGHEEEEALMEKLERIKTKQFNGVHKLIKAIDQLDQRSGDHQTLNFSSAASTNFDLNKIGFLKEFLICLDFNSFYFHH